MLVVMDSHATPEQVEHVMREAYDFTGTSIKFSFRDEKQNQDKEKK